MMRGVGGVRKSIHQSWLAKGLRLGLLCWYIKGVPVEIPSEEASTLQIRASGISTRTIHQTTTQSLSQTIWLWWVSRQLLTLAIVLTLRSVTFAYSHAPEAVVMRQLRRWKRLWRRSLTRSHKRASMGPCRSCWNGTTSGLQPEEITSKWTRVLRVYYKKSAHTKQAWKTIVCTLYLFDMHSLASLLTTLFSYLKKSLDMHEKSNIYIDIKLCMRIPRIVEQNAILISFLYQYFWNNPI